MSESDYERTKHFLQQFPLCPLPSENMPHLNLRRYESKCCNCMSGKVGLTTSFFYNSACIIIIILWQLDYPSPKRIFKEIMNVFLDITLKMAILCIRQLLFDAVFEKKFRALWPLHLWRASDAPGYRIEG